MHKSGRKGDAATIGYASRPHRGRMAQNEEKDVEMEEGEGNPPGDQSCQLSDWETVSDL